MKNKIIPIIIILVSIFFCISSNSQTISDNRPSAGQLKCEQVIIPQNDPLLVNVLPDSRVVEQESDDEEYKKWAEDFTRKKLAKEKKYNCSNVNKNDFPVETLSGAPPVLGRNFKGNSSGMTPSDCGFAISNSSYMVSAINGTVNFYDTNGVAIQSSTLANFMMEGSSAYVFDPRVIYDPVNDKFIFCALSGSTNGKAIILFSTSDDPAQAWNKYSLSISNMGGNSSNGLDYPHIGITDKELFLGITITGANKFPLIQINKKSGFSGTPLNYNTWIGQSSQPQDCTIPVTLGQQGSSYGNAAYFLQPNRTGSSTIYLFKISDTLGSANPTLTKYPLSTAAYSPAGYVSQKGSSSTMQTSNCRPMSAVFVNGIIHYVFHTDYNGTGYYGIRYGRIDVNNNNAMQISHIENTANQIEFCYPSVASIGNSPNDKSVLITFMMSGTSIYPSTGAVLCDDQMNWSAPIQIKGGTGSISGGRWGDYTCSSRRHNSLNPTVWSCAQYGKQGASYEMWIGEIISPLATDVQNADASASENKVYPNPAIDLFYLQFASEKDQQVKIDIVDLQGKQAKELYNAPVTHGINTLSFNKAALAQGIYVIRIRSSANKIIFQEKLIVEGN